jgi:hydrogenase nickel incorporation protein HypA/HybF
VLRVVGWCRDVTANLAANVAVLDCGDPAWATRRQNLTDRGSFRVHELSIATAIVEACVDRAAGNRIIRIRVEVGQLAAILPDSLQFCFELCARNTAAEGATLEILEIPGRALCVACGEAVILSSPLGQCECGGRMRITDGDQLRMRDMEIA